MSSISGQEASDDMFENAPNLESSHAVEGLHNGTGDHASPAPAYLSGTPDSGVKRKRGRPPKKRSHADTSLLELPACSVVLKNMRCNEDSHEVIEIDDTSEEVVDTPVKNSLGSPQVKRKRGRPKKILTPQPTTGGQAIKKTEVSKHKSEIAENDDQHSDRITPRSFEQEHESNVPHIQSLDINFKENSTGDSAKEANRHIDSLTLPSVHFSDDEEEESVANNPVVPSLSSLSELVSLPSKRQVSQRADEVHSLLLLWGEYNNFNIETGGWNHKEHDRSMDIVTESNGILRVNLEVTICLTPKINVSCHLDANDIVALNVDRLRAVVPKLRQGEWSECIRSSSKCSFSQLEGSTSSRGRVVTLHLEREMVISVRRTVRK